MASKASAQSELTEFEQLIQKADALRNKGLGEEAAVDYQHAAELSLRSGNVLSAAGAIHMKGVSLKHTQDLANTAFVQAIELYQKASDQLGAGRVYRDMAIPYAYKHQYDKALELLNQSESSLKKQGSSAELAITIAKIGHVQARLGNLNIAREKLNDALGILRQHPAPFYEMTTRLHIAQLDLQKKQHQKAIDEIGAAIKALSAEDSSLNEDQLVERYGRRFAQLYGVLANAYLGLGETEQAVSYLAKSLDLIQPLNNDAAAVLHEDIAAGDMIIKLKVSHPELYDHLSNHSEIKRIISS